MTEPGPPVDDRVVKGLQDENSVGREYRGKRTAWEENSVGRELRGREQRGKTTVREENRGGRKRLGDTE